MPVYLNAAQYAEHRGVKRAMVGKYISSGKLSKSIKKVGIRYQIDRDKADEELSQNLDQLHSRKKKKPDKTEVKKVVHDAGFDGLTLMEAQTENQKYAAALKKLDFEKRKGELVLASDVKKAMSNIIMTARGGVIAWKGRIAPILKEFLPNPAQFGRCMEAVDDLTDEILQGLADANR
jgi:hypothetical protein